MYGLKESTRVESTLFYFQFLVLWELRRMGIPALWELFSFFTEGTMGFVGIADILE